MTSGDTPAVQNQAAPGLVQQLRTNPRLPLIIGIAAAVTLLVGLVLWTMGPSYSVLFSNLSNRDGGAIIAKLEQMQVPYRFAANGTTLMVPQDVVDETRLKLAGDNLPKSGNVGFELMDNQAFGISQFAEHVNYNRALEGELARSIQTIAAVANARVHLAIPQSSVFVREREEPSASIVLDLYSGRALSDGQVSAIVNLVASSVTHLPADAVTVVDGSGHLLSRPPGGMNQGINGSQLAYVERIENAYRKSIETILAPVVGRDNIRAQVAADIDFSVGEHTEEIYTPNGDRDDAAVRSEQRTASNNNGGAMIGGVPGALSNQPSPDAPSPINNPSQDKNNPGNANQKLAMDGPGGLAASGSKGGKSSSNTSSTINYEVNRTIRHIREQTGRIKRLSTAVVINAPAPTDTEANGDPQAQTQTVALSDERMQQIKSLVREAVGFSAARGDSLEVINIPFNERSDPGVTDTTPWWQDRGIQALAIKAAKYLLIALVAWLAWRKLARPLLDQLPAPQTRQLATAGGPPTTVRATVGDDDEGDDEMAAIAANRERLRKQKDTLVTSTRDVAKNDPQLVAMIVKGWMHRDG